jgi:hypothetical protein
MEEEARESNLPSIENLIGAEDETKEELMLDLLGRGGRIMGIAIGAVIATAGTGYYAPKLAEWLYS